jgi:hypothetical protein
MRCTNHGTTNKTTPAKNKGTKKLIGRFLRALAVGWWLPSHDCADLQNDVKPCPMVQNTQTRQHQFLRPNTLREWPQNALPDSPNKLPLHLLAQQTAHAHPRHQPK